MLKKLWEMLRQEEKNWISRRWFLTWAIAFTTASILEASPVHAEETESQKKFREAVERIGAEEMSFFQNIFRLENLTSWEFENFVQDIQRQLWVDPDGALGPNTLKQLYLQYYIPNSFPLSSHQLLKYEIYQEMQDYPNHPRVLPGRTLRSSYNRNVFDSRVLFWGVDRISANANFPEWNLYINRSLYGNIPANESPNSIFIEKFGEKTILRLYDQYGQIQVATFVSPGTRKHPTPENASYISHTKDLYHLSSVYPEKDGEPYGGAVMPYARHVVGWVWIHGTDGVADGHDRSHGCIRVPLFYAKKIFEYGDMMVHIGDIY